MSWWTDVRDGTLKELGLQTTEQVAAKLTREAKNAVASKNNTEQIVPEVVTNPWAEAAGGAMAQISGAKVAGIALPLVIAGGALLFILLRRK